MARFDARGHVPQHQRFVQLGRSDQRQFQPAPERLGLLGERRRSALVEARQIVFERQHETWRQIGAHRLDAAHRFEAAFAGFADARLVGLLDQVAFELVERRSPATVRELRQNRPSTPSSNWRTRAGRSWRLARLVMASTSPDADCWVPCRPASCSRPDSSPSAGKPILCRGLSSRSAANTAADAGVTQAPHPDAAAPRRVLSGVPTTRSGSPSGPPCCSRARVRNRGRTGFRRARRASRHELSA